MPNQQTRSEALRRRIEVLKERDRMIHDELNSLGERERKLLSDLRDTTAESNALVLELNKLVDYE